MIKNTILFCLLLVVSSCLQPELNEELKKESRDEIKNNSNDNTEDSVYDSGVSDRFEKSFINSNGLFFDDFQTIPRHTSPKSHEGRDNYVRYSYHSIVEKENWGPKNNSVEVIQEDELNYLKINLSPKQGHKKIKGYRAELTIEHGNPNLEEEWYEWRFMIPKDYELDEDNKGREVSIVQHHYVKPKGEDKVITGPTIIFTYLEQYGKNILLRYGIKGEDESVYEGFDWSVVALDDTIKKGVWYTIRANIKWSLTNQGYIAA